MFTRLVPLCVALAVAAAACRSGVSPEQAAQVAADLVTATQRAPVDVVGVTPLAGMHKVVVRGAGGAESVLYVTADGTHVTTVLQDVVEEHRQLAEERRFADCLKASGVSLLVDRGQPSSRAQLAELGRFADALAIDCARDPENCRALGVVELPTTRHGKTLHAGRRTVAWLETLTGCKR